MRAQNHSALYNSSRLLERFLLLITTELIRTRRVLCDRFVRTNVTHGPYIEGRRFFTATSVTSTWVKIVPTALSLADLWQRPCPLAEVSLQYDSEEADARVGRRGHLCGGKHACGAILFPSPTCALTLRLLKNKRKTINAFDYIG